MIYVLRLLPPIALYKKYHFDSLDTLIATTYNFYDSLKSESIELTNQEKQKFNSHKFNFFCDCIQIFSIDNNSHPNIIKLFPQNNPTNIPIDLLTLNQPYKPITIEA